jgi:hypothetical protein
LKSSLKLLQKYTLTNPKPELTFLSKIFIIATISIMLLAASRTSLQFFLSEFMSANKFLAQYIFMGSIQVYAAIEAILSVLGIEGLLVGLGVADVYKRGESIINRDTIMFMPYQDRRDAKTSCFRRIPSLLLPLV